MRFGRPQDPATMGRLTFSEGVGPLSLEKYAASRFENAANHVLKALHFAYQHPHASGALIGAALGAATSPAGADSQETARNTIGSLLGGAMSGAMVGDITEKTKGNPHHAKHMLRAAVFTGRQGPSAGRALMDAFAPQPAPPAALVDILGKKSRYSDVDLQKKYQEENPTGAREQKYIGALRSLYSNADQSRDPPNTKELLKQKGKLLGNLGGSVASSVFMGETLKNSLIQAAPAIINTVADVTKTVRQNYLNPAVQVGDVRDAKTRASFSDAQLRRLLQGLRVEQVQEHAIK